ncbi:hypothetical protein H8M03_09590 [Sphingomonas sabuli]|uniref:Uncharacterized protein n=1 Tax=Sphingomonas sabuli TaxID=2764186 RepID=A0A7G9L0W7_9SPHN|nr:hypothetical protein [Sphingomonas sabuli]QNM82266.1 hypothetical protein H8M03_09590 [Sphingomonas sabuli]
MIVQHYSDAVRASANKGVFQPARAQIAAEMRDRLYLRQGSDDRQHRHH